MIAVKGLQDIIGKKISNEISKNIIRLNMPHHVANQLCDVIDRQESS